MTLAAPIEIESPHPTLQPQGWLRYFSFSLDHKVIGLQYLVTGFLFYLLGGALAGIIGTAACFMLVPVFAKFTHKTTAHHE